LLRGLGYGTAVVIENNYFYGERQSSALVSTKIREPIWIIQQSATSSKIRKGTLRWMAVVQGGEAGDTYDNKLWLQVSSKAAPFVVGPWDGVTTPILWP
jgi:hypothetical protein